jgi:hypothetical protein
MRTFFMIGVFFLSAAGAIAAPATDTYVVPLAGHVGGANGETWTTDVIVHNLEPATLVVDLAGVDSFGADLELAVRTATVGPHGTMTLSDLFRPGQAGALLVAGTAPFALRVRVHAHGPRGSFGADVTPATEFIDASSSGAFLTGVAGNAGTRSSIGFLAIAGVTGLEIEVTILDGGAVTLGSRMFAVEPGAIRHVHANGADFAAGAFDNATARIRVIDGDGVVTPYATVVDNLSSDAAFISPSSGASAPSTTHFRKVIQRLMMRGQR